MTNDGNRNLALPIAIVVGSLIIGVGLYLGLREGSRSAAMIAPVAPVAPVAPQVKAPAVAPSEPPPGPSVYERAQRQAQAALDSLQPGLSMRCWTPPAAGEPTSVTLDYEVTFGADASIVVLAISEQRQAFRSGVTECVRQQSRPALAIDAPGESVQVYLVLTLP